MEKRLTCTRADRETLSKVFNCTQRMIYKALTFESNTDLAKRIRKAAVERGSVEIAGNVMETFHDIDNVMRQYMPNGAVVEFDKKTGAGDVIFHGEVKEHYDRVMIADIAGIQRRASMLR